MSSSTRQRKAERDQARQRQQQLYLVIVIAIVAVAAVAVVIVSTQPLSTPAEAALGEHYAGIERGTSEEGMPQLGSPDAPVTIHNYSSFTCPHCATFHDNQFVELLSEIRAGEVRFVFVPVSNQSSAPATAAAFCAEEQGRFWEMHDLLFSWLGQYGGSAFAQARLVQGAEGLGLDTEAFSACLNAPETQARIEEANALWFALAQAYQGQPNEVTGTPTLTFNGVPPEWGSGAPNIETIRQVIAQVSGG